MRTPFFALCLIASAGAGALAIAPAFAADATTAPSPPASAQGEVPAWLFPIDPPAKTPVRTDPNELLGLANSKVKFSRAQLADLHASPDWHPGSHDTMPPVVARGEGPRVAACGYCHTPGGQGRPENAPVAGLPADYMVQQVLAFASGERRSAWPQRYDPAALMIESSQALSRPALEAAARYFSQQTLHARVHVVEAARVPRAHVIGLVYEALAGAGDEALGERLMEFAPSAEQHERHDDQMVYTAYAPLGSVGRGEALARNGVVGKVNACVNCHGAGLRGVGQIPPLAGRSPTYLLRSLFAYQNGHRAGLSSAPMRPIVSGLDTAQMIDVCAYAASLPP